MEVTNGEIAPDRNRDEVATYFSDTEKTRKECAITGVLSRVSDKWTMHTIICLGRGSTLRFTELKKMIAGISQRMLTVTLRTLEEDGFVTRRQYPEIPPRVEYTLTPLGLSLLNEMIGLSKWANENMTHVYEAREAFARRTTGHRSS